MVLTTSYIMISTLQTFLYEDSAVVLVAITPHSEVWALKRDSESIVFTWLPAGRRAPLRW